MSISNCKIVVFDLDETLGYFMEFGMFWDGLKEYIKYTQQNQPMDQDLFTKALDLYPEFLRPNIIPILQYLKTKKETNHCHKLMIYTNNQGPVEWANFIMRYFEQKLQYTIFDKIIAAFKVNGKQVELCRTSHMKTHGDFIKCTKLPANTHICFLDDVYYPDMSNDKIYYINVKPYVHDLDFEDMITRFLQSNLIEDLDPVMCKECILLYMKKYNYICIPKTQENQHIDLIVSKKIMQHLQEFFRTNNNHNNNNNNKQALKKHSRKYRTKKKHKKTQKLY